MDVERSGSPTFTLTVSEEEMRMLVVAADMLGTAASDTPAFPLSIELQDQYNDLYYNLIDSPFGLGEDTAVTLEALGIVVVRESSD